jgi:hypothetical protein
MTTALPGAQGRGVSSIAIISAVTSGHTAHAASPACWCQRHWGRIEQLEDEVWAKGARWARTSSSAAQRWPRQCAQADSGQWEP